MWRQPVCDGCGVADFVSCMIQDYLWQMIKPFPGPYGGLLCICCMEKRLGRQLTMQDLKPCGITEVVKIGYRIATGERQSCKQEDTPVGAYDVPKFPEIRSIDFCDETQVIAKGALTKEDLRKILKYMDYLHVQRTNQLASEPQPSSDCTV